MTRRELEVLDEALAYLNEGKMLDKVKGIINHTINKNFKAKFNPFKKKISSNNKEEHNNTTTVNASFDKISSKSQFDKLYNTEAFCAEGWDMKDIENVTDVCNILADMWGLRGSLKFECYWCIGSDMNTTYKLTGDNAYIKDLHFFFIDWQKLPSSFDPARHKANDGLDFRYFADVVDNNARREINKGNKFYQDYHSIYGDDWFRGTCNPPDNWDWTSDPKPFGYKI